LDARVEFCRDVAFVGPDTATSNDFGVKESTEIGGVCLNQRIVRIRCTKNQLFKIAKLNTPMQWHEQGHTSHRQVLNLI